MAEDKEQEAAFRSADLNVFDTGRFTDAVVTCGAKSWFVHRTILCARSEWFDRALAGPFMVSTDCKVPYCSNFADKLAQEGEGVVDIGEQDPDAVELCLRYIYGGGK